MNYKDCYVRPFAWRGGKLMGLSTTNSDVHVSIAVWDDWTTYYKLEDMMHGLTLILHHGKGLRLILFLSKPKHLDLLNMHSFKIFC